MTTIDQMLDSLFTARTARMQEKIQRQRKALRRLQSKRGVEIVSDTRIRFDDQEWMPVEEFEKLRSTYEAQVKAWRTYDIDDIHTRRMHKGLYEYAERHLSALPSLTYDRPYSPQYALSVVLEEYRGMLAMGLREKLAQAERIEVARG